MKFKKSIYAFSSLAMVVAPVATVVACGDDDDDDDANTGGTGGTTGTADIVWRTNNRNNGVQYEAMVDVAKMYNDTHDGGNVKVLSKDDDGGAGNSDAFLTAIGAKDERAIPNLYLDYPDTAGVVASQSRALEVVAPADVQDTRDMFVPGLVDQNDQIGGLDPDGMYIAPWSKSTEMMALNGPVMYAVLTIMEANGELSATNRTQIDAILNNTDYKVDGEELLKAPTLTTTSTYEPLVPLPTGVAVKADAYDDSLFTEASTLIDFAIQAKTYIKDPAAYILGIDSNANFLYANVFGLGQADMDKFLFHKAAGKSNIDMEWLKAKTGDGYDNFVKVYDKWAEGISSGAVYVKHTPSGSSYASYGSDYLKINAMGLSIGSTAGYGYLTLAQSSPVDDHLTLQTNELTALKVPEKFDSTSSAVSLVQGPSLMAVDKSDKENATVHQFVSWLLNDKVADWPATGTLGQGSNLTGAERYNTEASYITPTVDAMASPTPPTSFNPAQAVAYNTLHSGTSGTVLFDNPVDRFTNLHRSTLETTMAQEILDPGAMRTADEMREVVLNALKGGGHPEL